MVFLTVFDVRTHDTIDKFSIFKVNQNRLINECAKFNLAKMALYDLL